jgi:KRAB domain-containing zinc finger protein
MTVVGAVPKIINDLPIKEHIKIEGPEQREIKWEDNEGQMLSEDISKDENKTSVKLSTKKESGLISVLDHDWETFDCNQCDKKYNARGALYAHKQAIHLGIKLQCDQCSFTTKRKGHLKEHIQNKHEQIVCDLCGKEMSGGSLTDHKRVVHEGILNKCNQCGSMFLTRRILSAHKAEQHGGRSYVCTGCGKGFRRKLTLDGHAKSKHNADGRLGCKECGMSFASRRAMLLHKQSKHDLIKYTCDKCSHQASQLGNLTTHKKKKHNKPSIEPGELLL